jgi:hypothetical protein
MLKQKNKNKTKFIEVKIVEMDKCASVMRDFLRITLISITLISCATLRTKGAYLIYGIEGRV